MYLIYLFKCLIISIITCLITTNIVEYLYNKHVCTQIKLINRYLKVLQKKYITITHKGILFCISTNTVSNDPVYEKYLFINNEIAMITYELKRSYTTARVIEVNQRRSEQEIAVIRKLALKKLKKLYNNKYLKIDQESESYYSN